MHFRNLLDHLGLAALSLQLISGWLMSPMRTRLCECECEVIPTCLYRTSYSCSSQLGGLYQAPTMAPLPVFSLILTHKLCQHLIHPQADLYAFQLLSHVKDNSHSFSSQPVFPQELVSLHCKTPVMGAIQPHPATSPWSQQGRKPATAHRLLTHYIISILHALVDRHLREAPQNIELRNP